MEHRYKFAGLSLCVTTPEDILYADHGVLRPFLSDNEESNSYRLTFSLVDQLTAPIGECTYRDTGMRVYRNEQEVVRYAGALNRVHMRLCRHGRSSEIECLRREYPLGITPKTVLNAMEAEHLIVQNSGVILHAAYIQVGEQAILFTAPSGTGKSTQADLWCRRFGARLINGDRVAVRTEGRQVWACGIPFAGSSGVAENRTLPIAAIVSLSQAPTNSAEELTALPAFRKVWEGCCVNLWDREDMTLATDTVLKVIQSTPVVHFSCTPRLDAADYLESFLTQRRYLDV